MGAHAITSPFGLAHPTPLEAAASACADHVHAATCEAKELIGVTCVYCLLHKLLLLLLLPRDVTICVVYLPSRSVGVRHFGQGLVLTLIVTLLASSQRASAARLSGHSIL